MELINFSKVELNLMKLLAREKELELKDNKTAKEMDEQEDLDFKIMQAKQKCFNSTELMNIINEIQTQEQAKRLQEQIKESTKQARELIKQINKEIEDEKKYPLLNDHILKSWKMDIEIKELKLARIFVNNKCNSITQVLEIVEDFLKNKTNDLSLAVFKIDTHSKALDFNNCEEIKSLKDIKQIISNKEYDDFKEIANNILEITNSHNYIRKIYTLDINKENTFYVHISTNEILKIKYEKTTENKIKILDITEAFIEELKKEMME